MSSSNPAAQARHAQARREAQRIVLGPMMFQAARALRDLGILSALRGAPHGLPAGALAEKTGTSRPGVQVLLEAGRMAGLVNAEGERYSLTETGYCMLFDELTRINMDVVQHCCYQGLQYLEDSIREQKPVGLQRTFGDWDTIYPALPTLPEPARSSWYRWDHHYSDAAFPQALPLVFRRPHRRLLDVGANTGKWTLRCLAYAPEVSVTLVDLPAVLVLAEAALRERGLEGRATACPMDLLDHARPLPTGFDALWMSQFLVCFGEEDVARILARAAAAMDEGATLYILDTFPDRQAYEAAAYSLEAFSLYFTCLANGRSRMYKAAEIQGFLGEAGLEVEEVVDGLGICSSLLVCRKARPSTSPQTLAPPPLRRS